MVAEQWLILLVILFMLFYLVFLLAMLYVAVGWVIVAVVGCTRRLWRWYAEHLSSRQEPT